MIVVEISLQLFFAWYRKNIMVGAIKLRSPASVSTEDPVEDSLDLARLGKSKSSQVSLGLERRAKPMMGL